MPAKVFTQDEFYRMGCRGIAEEAARRLSTWDSKQHFTPASHFNPIAGIVGRMFGERLYPNAAARKRQDGNLFYWRNKQAGRLGLCQDAGKVLFYCHPKKQPKAKLAKCLHAIAERHYKNRSNMSSDELMELMRGAGVSEEELAAAAKLSSLMGHGSA